MTTRRLSRKLGTEFPHVEVEQEGVVGFFEGAAALGGEGVGRVVADQEVAGVAGFEFVAEAVRDIRP